MNGEKIYLYRNFIFSSSAKIHVIYSLNGCQHFPLRRSGHLTHLMSDFCEYKHLIINYLPMQKREKMEPRISLVDISPVISPK